MALLDGNQLAGGARALDAQRRWRARREALVRWKDFGHHGDTWEPEEHVVPKAKITNFLSRAHEELPLR